MSGKQLILITGLSGSGKSTVAESFEDLGFYCVDNLPVPLLRLFLRNPMQVLEGHDRIAVVADIRAPRFASEFPSLVDEMETGDVQPVVLFLEANEDCLVRRFSETRRPHPLAADRPLLDGIRQERELMANVRGRADRVLDTSDWTVHDARSQIFEQFADQSVERHRPIVSVVSFGFKHGIPAGTDLMFDVRFLPNPHFEDELRPQSGKDAAVRQYLERIDDYGELLARVSDLLLFALPRYRREKRAYVSVAIGCTGGRHRSVAVAEELQRRLAGAGWTAQVLHRDINR